MKQDHLFYRALSILCLLAFVLAACAPAATATTAPEATEPEATEPAATEPEATEPAATEPVATQPSAGEPVTLTLLTSLNENDQLMINALTEAYTAMHPNVTFDIEIPPVPVDEVPNLVQTRLATGEMNDIFYFNSGALIQPLNPSETLVDLSGEPFIANIAESFLPTVSQDGGIYGVPVGYAAAGGVLYNRKIYEQLGLSVPKTWEEFAANNEAIKEAGIPPVLQTYGDTWTAQLFVLADNYNIAQAHPNFAEDYTNNKAKYAEIPEAMAGFEHLREGFEKGWYQPDFETALFEQGLEMLANGEVAQYPMLTQVMNTVATNYPDQVNDIGFFALPGKDAGKNGATVWMPLAFYAPKTAQNIDVIKDFFAFVASTEGTDAITAKVTPAGPYLIKGATLSDDVLPFVNDLNAYIESGNSYPALEFLSPVKGPLLPQLCVSAGTGQMTPEEAAAAYDEDVKKQAEQLGLPGW
jgi:raffinose/stachyose/melibiose transport system substrate-binding protein